VPEPTDTSPPLRRPTVVLVGVAGSGKSTVGPIVAEQLGVAFLDGDAYHDAAGIERMRRGIPLDDPARAPWLDRLHRVLVDHHDTGVVLACSALKAAYRAQLARGIDVRFVLLDVPWAALAARLEARQGHFAGVELLESQLTTLERAPDLVTVDANRAAVDVAADVVAAVTRT
jgi:gluconokinase